MRKGEVSDRSATVDRAMVAHHGRPVVSCRDMRADSAVEMRAFGSGTAAGGGVGGRMGAAVMEGGRVPDAMERERGC